MRKLRIRRIESRTGMSVQGYQSEVVRVDDSKKTTMFVFKSDDVSEETLIRLRTAIRRIAGNNALVVAMGESDSVEVYEVE